MKKWWIQKLSLFHLDNPEFSIKPEEVAADSGQEVSLVCEADGNPSPSYRWYRNNDITTVRIYFSFIQMAQGQ